MWNVSVEAQYVGTPERNARVHLLIDLVPRRSCPSESIEGHLFTADTQPRYPDSLATTTGEQTMADRLVGCSHRQRE